MKSVRFISSMVAVGLLALVGCSKDNESSGSMSKMEVRLIDGPGDYKAVNLDVQSVQVHVKDGDDEKGWENFALINPRSYNVMEYVNGNSALLASADFPAGRISQIRLVLGPNNTVTLKNGQVKPLTTPSGQTSGLKLKIDADITRDVTYQLVLDFDVAKSIVARGNGEYNLKPVIRTITTAIAGGIKGKVSPVSQPQILVIRNAAPIDTFSTSPNAEGGFLVRGLAAGSYRVEFWNNNALYSNSTKQATVTNDQIADLGTVELK
ncbi:DUF4382 domain-containing protein [Hymenobacter sp. BT491]|uniref:DUF4382 domain-containing protein n=1 Tax=Hymenobacter sp. BT491 TaxID=2766779 RepID=UPI0021CCDBDE|nr:DUF4382 domain-containing protein [Hymenobacter sp. BT491]